MDNIHKKEIIESNEDDNKNKLNEKKAFETGISIKERIKLFSGKDRENKITNKNQNIPGKLKIPQMFQNSNNSMNINNKDEKNRDKSRKNTSNTNKDSKQEIYEKK